VHSCLFFPSGPVLYYTAPCKWGQPCWSGPTSQQLVRRRKHVFASRRNHGFTMIRAPTASCSSTGNRKVITLTRKRDGSHVAACLSLPALHDDSCRQGPLCSGAKAKGRDVKGVCAQVLHDGICWSTRAAAAAATLLSSRLILLSCLLHRKKVTKRYC
jgi:hypothetical protein